VGMGEQRRCRRQVWRQREWRDEERRLGAQGGRERAGRAMKEDGEFARGWWDWSACDWDRWGRVRRVDVILYVTFVSFSGRYEYTRFSPSLEAG